MGVISVSNTFARKGTESYDGLSISGIQKIIGILNKLHIEGKFKRSKNKYLA